MQDEEDIESAFEEASADSGKLPSRLWLSENFRNKSSMIRYLASKNFDVNTIAKHVDVRYQHAYNVIERMHKQPQHDGGCPVCRRKI